MDLYLTRLYREGVALSPHSRVQSGRLRGRLIVEQRHVPDQHRVMRIAEFMLPLNSKDRGPPQLHDVDLLTWTPDFVVLTGYERVAQGPLGVNAAVRQSWHLVPAPIEDLIKAETTINTLARELHELRHMK